MVDRSKPEPSDIGHPKPSEVTDAYWLSAVRKVGEYPSHAEQGGKWLIFVPLAQIDEVWEKIRDATEKGLLGGSAKVATAVPNPNAKNHNAKVICVYTYDGTDEADVLRVRQSLRQLGIVAKIPYKADNETRAGSYANRGHKRISHFYE